ncbi:hypothetical protein F2Q69_00015740 [Brassica cretica]|uniref:Uncharacterized protein n=1 Tax=Brassica cretica TaxID=69181 RepID=A0A8S9QYV1_BRACR|nr:hypothetical protein F2Q69_00015740 [Brassica cretica]
MQWTTTNNRAWARLEGRRPAVAAQGGDSLRLRQRGERRRGGGGRERGKGESRLGFSDSRNFLQDFAMVFPMGEK